MSDLHRLGIGDLRRAYAAGETSPGAVVDHYLARIERFQPSLRAYIDVDAAGARAAAEESGRLIAAGKARPLEGVPVAVKSNIAVRGLGWNAGMEARRGIVAETDSEAVRRLREAGAILLGTLNMHEAALGATNDNPWFGKAMNPHREGYTPGGSSGGSGAAVAAGLCVASLGTDTLGSVRIPAAYNGVYGIKPTHGAISDEGLVPLSKWLDSIGPIAHSVADLEELSAVLSDLSGQPSAGQTAFGRLIVLDSFEGFACEPAVIDAYERALALLGDLPPEELTLEDDAAGVRFAGFVVAGRELITHLGDMRIEAADKLSEELKFMLSYTENRSDADVERAGQILDRTRKAVRDAVGTNGVMLMPTSPQVAFAHSERPPATQSAFTSFANIAGLPSIAIPAGTDQDGLPLSIQLVGPENSETALMALAARLDEGLGGYVLSPLM